MPGAVFPFLGFTKGFAGGALLDQSFWDTLITCLIANTD